MKKTTLFLILISIALLASACAAPAAQPAAPAAAPADSTPTPFAAAFLTIDYPDAASLRNQLAYGTLQMEAGANPITSEQASTLLPLWQALRILSSSTTASDEEITALQNQIVEALTPEQLQTIAAMQLTNTALNAYYAEFGVVMPTPAPGVTKVPGSGVPSADKEATRTAAQALGTPVGTGAGQAAKTLLYDHVIEFLARLSGG